MPSPVGNFQFSLIHELNIPGSCAILFFTASDFTFTIRHIHNWVLFLLWLSLFTLSGDISNCPLLFPVAYWTPSDLGGLIFWSHIFLPFYTVHGVLTPGILEWFAISSSSGPHFARTLHCDLTVLGGPAWLGSQLHWVTQAPLPWQSSDPWRGYSRYPSAICFLFNIVSFKTYPH